MKVGGLQSTGFVRSAPGHSLTHVPYLNMSYIEFADGFLAAEVTAFVSTNGKYKYGNFSVGAE